MFLIISDITWQTVHGTDPLPWFRDLTGAHRPQPIPLTPRARIWLTDHHHCPTPDSTNALASALTTLFTCQTGPVFGPACVTAYHPAHGAADLDPSQAKAFIRLLTALSDPTTLARHRMACRLAATWHTPNFEETGQCS